LEVQKNSLRDRADCCQAIIEDKNFFGLKKGLAYEGEVGQRGEGAITSRKGDRRIENLC